MLCGEARMQQIDEYQYMERILALERPGEANFLVFYDHRLRACVTNPRLMLIPMDDHLVHRGDGVFETLKFVDGKLYQLDAHIQRLRHSLETIFITPPAPWKDIRHMVMEVARIAGVSNGLVSIFIGRGLGGFSLDFRECEHSTLYIVARRFPSIPHQIWDKGVHACRTTIPAKPREMARIKSVNYLNNVLMKREAILKGCAYPLCFGPDHFLAEGAAENIIIVDHTGQMVVPEMSHALPGTTMLRALELIARERDYVTRPISEDDVRVAREVILLGTSIDALSIVRYNGKPIHDVRPGPVSKRLRQLLQEDLHKNGTPLDEGEHAC
jgi:branched-chain amino acid aminotransferase